MFVKRPFALVVSALLLAAGVAAPNGGPAQGAGLRDGSAPERAAASCWEIKEEEPSAPDGAYWLQTPAMDSPSRFFCDQTTDGGGWVLIGRGRENWEAYSRGQGDASALLERERTPADFPVVQYSERIVDELLNGAPVSETPDGVRVLRAMNESGTAWQRVDLAFNHLGRFEWFFNSYSDGRIVFDATTGSDFLSLTGRVGDAGWYGFDASPKSNTRYRLGFAYGPRVGVGSTSPASFIWRERDGALPYSEVYLRPRLRSDEGFGRIPDEGTSEELVPATVSDLALPTSWGVVGNLNGRTREGNSPVQAFAQIGSTMFVGGNFTGVQKGSKGSPVPRTALAAFDAVSGDFIPSFNAEFDGQVKALKRLPDGRLLAGGEFTRVNGSRHTGTVVLDPATGTVDESWDLQILNLLKSAKGVVSVRSIDLDGGFIYIGGSFTHLQKGDGRRVYARAAGRAGLDGDPDPSWNPEFNGTLMDLDATGSDDRFYAVGYFTRTNGGKNPANKAAVLRTSAGAEPALDFAFRPSQISRATYQQTVVDTGSRVYIGGAQHSFFGYDRADMRRESGTITVNNGGDMQTSVSDGTTVYAGCHCFSRGYEDAYTFPDPGRGWRSSTRVQSMIAWDAPTGRLIGWTPFELRSGGGAGAWGSELSERGDLWLGGDYRASRNTRDRVQWNGGFVVYPARDRVAPARPGALRAVLSGDSTQADLSWDPVADAASYQVLRDDRVIATTREPFATLPASEENRFFVRAVDEEGNIGASTPVAVAAARAPEEQAAPEPDEQSGDSASLYVAKDAAWSYLYSLEDPGPEWFSASTDSSAWPTGRAPLGYGDASVRTLLAPIGGTRPVTAYFRRGFNVDEPAGLRAARLVYTADDGAIVRINGIEVSRTRMSEGAASHETRAHEAVSTAKALEEPTSVIVPAELLRVGANEIEVETHVNYRRSRSLTFSASLEGMTAE